MSDKLLKMLHIYQSGYSTHSMHTLEEWFEARDYCKRNFVSVKVFTDKISGTIPQLNR